MVTRFCPAGQVYWQVPLFTFTALLQSLAVASGQPNTGVRLRTAPMSPFVMSLNAPVPVVALKRTRRFGLTREADRLQPALLPFQSLVP